MSASGMPGACARPVHDVGALGARSYQTYRGRFFVSGREPIRQPVSPLGARISGTHCGRGWRHTPHGVPDVVGDQQGAMAVNGNTDRTAERFARGVDESG